MPNPYPNSYEIFPALPGLPVTDINRFSTRSHVSSQKKWGPLDTPVKIVEFLSQKPCLLLHCEVWVFFASAGDRYLVLVDSSRVDYDFDFASKYSRKVSGGTGEFVRVVWEVPSQGLLFEAGIVVGLLTLSFNGNFSEEPNPPSSTMMVSAELLS